ncbi:MAG TPA: ATP-binding protein [Reyranella sp.]|nr:ATP-binding protein [Reyranella sp.]
MKPPRLRSLQLRLAVRLTVLFLLASAAIGGFLLWRAYDTAESIADRELGQRAADLAAHVRVAPDGTAQLVLPPRLREAYEASAGTDIFAIRAADGRMVAVQPQAFAAIAATWPKTDEDASYFRLPGIGADSRDYYGLGLTVDSAAGPLSVWVARAEGASALVHSFLEEFVFDIAWVIPLFMAVTVAIAILAIRGALRPIRLASDVAASIGPGTTSVRLPDRDLPSEIAPIVEAVNRALDRLEQGFAVQRQFTANAAHELRTPLAIVTAALDNLPANVEVDKLKADVERMNRLIEQLLSVARLDAVALDVSAVIDLNDPAREVVSSLAPWAVAQGRAIGFTAAGAPTFVRGNRFAIADAVRNLAENAVAHTPPGTEVAVAVHDDGRISVSDHGPGVPPQDRERIFERFSRGKGQRTQGAGLGLAIVREIMRAHGGRIAVDDAPAGGAIFALVFPLARHKP